MCIEHISIAVCAPAQPPKLSFTCGKLHSVAGKREVCGQAKGQCVCYFGTCGRVERAADTTPIDWAELCKVRCLTCTEREDFVAERRKGQALIDSPLLTRGAVPEDQYDRYFASLRDLWNGSDACPYHGVGDKDLVLSPSTGMGKETPPPRETPSRVNSSPGSSLDENQAIRTPTRNETPCSENHSLKPVVGIEASRWASAGTTAPPVVKHQNIQKPASPVEDNKPSPEASSNPSPGPHSPLDPNATTFSSKSRETSPAVLLPTRSRVAERPEITSAKAFLAGGR